MSRRGRIRRKLRKIFHKTLRRVKRINRVRLSRGGFRL